MDTSTENNNNSVKYTYLGVLQVDAVPPQTPLSTAGAVPDWGTAMIFVFLAYGGWSDAATPIVQHRAGKLLKNAPFVDRRKRLDRNPGDLGDGDLLGRRELDRRPVTNPVENVGRTLKDVVVRRPGKVAQQTLIGGGLDPDGKTPAGSIGRSHRSKDRNGLVEQKLFGIAHRSVARTKS